IANSIVIPAYNEQHRISATLEYLLDYIREHNLSAEIIVGNDGSSDQTADIVQSYASRSPGLSLLRTPQHRGKGTARAHRLSRRPRRGNLSLRCRFESRLLGKRQA